MTDRIEFEVTEPVTKKMQLITASVNEFGVWRPTTPAEFDAVAREKGYTKSNLTPLLTEISAQAAYEGEEWLDTLRRIIAERDGLKSEKEMRGEYGPYVSEGWHKARLMEVMTERDSAVTSLDEATSHSITLDGATYRGNEETIGKMRELHKASTWTTVPQEIADLKRQLAEANKDRNFLNQRISNQTSEIARRKVMQYQLNINGKNHVIECAPELVPRVGEELMIPGHPVRYAKVTRVIKPLDDEMRHQVAVVVEAG